MSEYLNELNDNNVDKTGNIIKGLDDIIEEDDNKKNKRRTTKKSNDVDNQPVVLEVDSDEMSRMELFRNKILKFNTMLKIDLKPFLEGRKLNELQLHELEKLYSQLQSYVLGQSGSGGLYSTMYFSAISIIEGSSNKMGINMNGLSNNLMSNPSVINNLALIEIEFGSFNVLNNPLHALLLATATTAYGTYNHNRMMINNNNTTTKNENDKI